MSEAGPPGGAEASAREAADRDAVVLVLRALGLGDALTAIPAMRGIRRAWPGRRLVLVGRGDIGQWLALHGLVDDAVSPPGDLADVPAWAGALRAAPGAVAVNLHGRGPQSHQALLATGPGRLIAFARPELGVQGPRWDAEEHEVDRWIRLVGAAGGRCGRDDLRLPPPGPRAGHVVVHPGAAFPARRWPAERYAAVVAALVASGRRVLVTGGAEERTLTARVAGRARPPHGGRMGAGVEDTAGRLGLRGLAEAVATADLLISGDTGVAHLGTAFATPSVVLFGPVPPRLWGPVIDPALHTVLWRGGGRQAAGRRGDPHGDVIDTALAALTVEEVLAAAERHLGAAPPRRPAVPVTGGA